MSPPWNRGGGYLKAASLKTSPGADLTSWAIGLGKEAKNRRRSLVAEFFDILLGQEVDADSCPLIKPGIELFSNAAKYREHARRQAQEGYE